MAGAIRGPRIWRALVALALVAGCGDDGTGTTTFTGGATTNSSNFTTSAGTTTEGTSGTGVETMPAGETMAMTTGTLPSCGDGNLDFGEECDDGADNGAGKACLDTCVANVCGDGDAGPGEGCDDGPDNADDAACTAACVAATCGDGLIQDGVEECDLGPDNGSGQACSAECLANVCGDGDLGPGEGCDDGNVDPGDGCSATCTLEGCGNGVVEPMEACDDGQNGDNDDGCTDACLEPACGDGFTQASLAEECDDGADNSDSAACTLACALNICGDGKVLMDAEECDEGDQNADTKACKADCTVNVCGDGKVLMGVEECDDGNDVDNDGCSNACKATTCGNGKIDMGERCDTALPPPYNGIGCKMGSCLYDFSTVPQLYCNGSCSWGGGSGCDQADADIFCKLRTGNPNSVAMGYQNATAQATNGFSCPTLNINLGTIPEYGVNQNVWYQPGSVLGNHGAGAVIINPTCTNP